MDRGGSGKIGLEQWFAACLDIDQHLTEERIKMVFDRFDKKKDGQVTMKCVEETFKDLGKAITDD